MTVADFFDKNILNKYNTTGPRYTSYPTALAFNTDFNERDFSHSVQQADGGKDEPTLSLYFHIPFCHSLCYYCGCNKIVTRNQDKVKQYLDYLKKEIRIRANKFTSFVVNNIHFGGGTPSFLSAEQLDDLLTEIRKHFVFAEKVEQSIEIDPRQINLTYVDELYNLGFNRLSIGVQDINKSVQEKINRVQSTSFIRDLITRAKKVGFTSVNIDLIYGLPGQDQEKLTNTLVEVKRMDPDRISLFSYAHMPSLFPAQRKIKEKWMPTSETKFALFRQSINTLCNLGYDFIGMDHFAKKTDVLSIAAKEHRLSRNFQGYTTDQSDCLLGLGVSSISNLGTAYAQNVKKLSDYYKALDGHQSILEKGINLTNEDVIHRAIINQLMCNFYVDKKAFEAKFSIQFDTFFAKHLKLLSGFEKDNLITNNDTSITIHSSGRLLVRNICMSFDQYLGTQAHQLRYSRVI
jgi:oxygen-independent coproporphyrinogen-3 oxidase